MVWRIWKMGQNVTKMKISPHFHGFQYTFGAGVRSRDTMLSVPGIHLTNTRTAVSVSVIATLHKKMSTLIGALRARVVSSGAADGKNLVAFSGGVDSSLVAALVHQVFPDNSLACLGVSAALPSAQLHLARSIARHIGGCVAWTGTGFGQFFCLRKRPLLAFAHDEQIKR